MTTRWRSMLTTTLGATALVALLSTTTHAQGPIACGELLNGAITPSGDADTWTFSANTGDAIVVRVGETGVPGTFYPRLTLFAPGGAQVAVGSGAFAAEVAVTAAASGTYSVVVNDGTGAGTATGTYRITLAKTGGAVSVTGGDEGGPLTNGALHTGAIDLGDLDVWTVSANAGEAIVVRMGEGASGGTLYPWLRIYRPDGTLADNSSGAFAAEVATTATASGTYLVVAGDGNSSLAGTDSYRLTLAKTGSPVTVSPGDDGGPLTNGALHTGAITEGDLDLWTVTASPGEAIVVRMGEGTASSAFYPWLRIYRPDGTLAASNSGAFAAEVATTATASGTYLVVAGDGNSSLAGTDSYRLTLAKTGSPVTVSPGDDGGPLTNGALHTGAITEGDLDLWTVTASPGEAIVVRMGEGTASSVFYPWLRIYGPTGILRASNSGAFAAEVAIAADSAGTYLVVAGDGNSSLAGTDSYRLTLAKTGSPVTVSPGDDGGPLTNGALHTGAITEGDLDLWTVTASPGEAIVVRMGEGTASSAFYPWLRIYGPTGILRASGSGAFAAEVAIAADSAGTYLVVAGDGNSSLAGTDSYRLTLAKTGSPVTVSPGDEGGPLLAALTPAFIEEGDIDAWTISYTAGANILVTMEDMTPGVGALYPWLRIYGPNGALVQSRSGSLYAQLSVVAPVSGTYLIVAGDGNSSLAATGPYRLTPGTTLDTPQAPVPFELAFAPPSPNPFAGRTRMHFTLPVAGRAALRVYDVQGRLVRTLVDEPAASAGEHDIVWDGRDAAGTPLQPGMYMARLETTGPALSRKLLLSR